MLETEYTIIPRSDLRDSVGITSIEADVINTDDLIGLYTRDFNIRPLLTPEEQDNLEKIIMAGQEEKLKEDNIQNPSIIHQEAEARGKFFEGYLRLVVSIAMRYKNLGVDLSDLIQEGNIGLWNAVNNFDPSKGNLMGYAEPFVRGTILGCIDDQSRTIRVPSHTVKSLSEIDKSIKNYKSQSGTEPTLEELSAETGLTIKVIEGILKRTRDTIQPVISLEQARDEFTDDSGIRTNEDLIEAQGPSPEELVINGDKTRFELIARFCRDKLGPEVWKVLCYRSGLVDGKKWTLLEMEEAFKSELGSREKIRFLETKKDRILRVYLEEIKALAGIE